MPNTKGNLHFTYILHLHFTYILSFFLYIIISISALAFCSNNSHTIQTILYQSEYFASIFRSNIKKNITLFFVQLINILIECKEHITLASSCLFYMKNVPRSHRVEKYYVEKHCLFIFKKE